MAVDHAGNAYAIGRASTNYEGAGYVTIKYDAQGSELWARLYGESRGTVLEPSAVQVDSSGNVHVTGSFLGGPYTTLKYGPDGRLLWLVSGGSDHPAGHVLAMVLDPADAVYVAGTTRISGELRRLCTIT